MLLAARLPKVMYFTSHTHVKCINERLIRPRINFIYRDDLHYVFLATCRVETIGDAYMASLTSFNPNCSITCT